MKVTLEYDPHTGDISDPHTGDIIARADEFNYERCQVTTREPTKSEIMTAQMIALSKAGYDVDDIVQLRENELI